MAKKNGGLVIVTIGKVAEFVCPVDDSRHGHYSADITLQRADEEGENRTWLSSDGLFAGLLPDPKRVAGEALELARAAATALEAVGERPKIVDENSDYNGSDDYLTGYLRTRAYRAERKAEADKLRAEAAELIAQADELCV